MNPAKKLHPNFFEQTMSAEGESFSSASYTAKARSECETACQELDLISWNHIANSVFRTWIPQLYNAVRARSQPVLGTVAMPWQPWDQNENSHGMLLEQTKVFSNAKKLKTAQENLIKIQIPWMTYFLMITSKFGSTWRMTSLRLEYLRQH